MVIQCWATEPPLERELGSYSLANLILANCPMLLLWYFLRAWEMDPIQKDIKSDPLY